MFKRRSKGYIDRGEKKQRALLGLIRYLRRPFEHVSSKGEVIRPDASLQHVKMAPKPRHSGEASRGIAPEQPPDLVSGRARVFSGSIGLSWRISEV